MVLLVALVVAYVIWDLTGGVIDDETIRAVVSLAVTAVSILGYKIPGWGYIFKFVTSFVPSYKVMIWLTPFMSELVNDSAGQLLIAQVILAAACTLGIFKILVDQTDGTFLETDGFDVYSVSEFTWKMRRAVSAAEDLLSNFSGKRRKRALEQEERNALEKRMLEERQQKLEEERRRVQDEERKIRYEKNRFEEQRREMQEKQQKIEAEKRRMEEEKQSIREEYEKISKEKADRAVLFFKGCKDEAAIKKRYRKLAQEFHPDGASGDEDMFKSVQAEYERLTIKSQVLK